MKIGMTDPDWNYIGAVLANSDDEAQINFLKAFLKECKSWGTYYQVEYQLASINRGLTGDEKEMLKMLVEN